MSHSANVPFSDGQGESFSNYAQHVELRGQVPNLGRAKRAAAPILQMDTAAREVCMAAGRDVAMDYNGAEKISELFRRKPRDLYIQKESVFRNPNALPTR